MSRKQSKIPFRYEKIIPVALFVLFVAITVPGISWGTPSLWNPDELVWRSLKALDGELKFDETEPDYNYPSLPKHVMFGIGWLVRELGGSRADMIVSARLISVVLGGLSVVLIYLLVKMVSENIYIRLLAAFLALSNTALAHNARFAHNDLYLLFFLTLALYALVRYRLGEQRGWLYLAFFSVGCAASSKYTGASFLLIVLLVFLIVNWNRLNKDWLRTAETLFIASVLTVVGYVIGTPKSLLWMSFYFKRMIPAALRFASYGRVTEGTIGFFGQWGTFRGAVGLFSYYLFLAAFIWFLVRFILFKIGKLKAEQKRMDVVLVLLISITVFDLPFLISYNYVPRFFLPFLPMFAVLAGLFVEDIITMLKAHGYGSYVKYLWAVVALLIAISFMQVASVTLLFAKDARIPAGEYLSTLKSGTVLEYTLYPPSVPENHFEAARNYPIYMIKYPGEVVPKGKPYRYNEGREGLYERGADYFVIDSLTYNRFYSPEICDTNPVECEFFLQLLDGQTDLNLLASFEYSLPAFLPQISISAVNPTVKIYEIPR